MRYLILALLVLFSFPVIGMGQSQTPQIDTSELIEKRLKSERYQEQLQSQRPFDNIQALQREIRRLNSQIVDLKVERDHWRTTTYELQEQARGSQQGMTIEEEIEVLETHLLIASYFEDILAQHEIPLPDEAAALKIDVNAELDRLRQILQSERSEGTK